MPELPIVAAGSLMEFLLSDHSFSMPVGRIEYLDLHPMTFTEFLRATGEDRLVREIESFEWPPGAALPAPHPVVHQRLLREGRSNNAEVDYVCELGGQIVPIEVKAGRVGTLKSVHQFVAENRVPFAVRFDADLPAVQTVDAEVRRGHGSERVRYGLLSLPLYLVERLPRLVNDLGNRI